MNKREIKTPERVIDMPQQNKYQPSKAENEQIVNMPGVSRKTVRKAIFRPIRSIG